MSRNLPRAYCIVDETSGRVAAFRGMGVGSCGDGMLSIVI